jgi:hypothetical protein
MGTREHPKDGSVQDCLTEPGFIECTVLLDPMWAMELRNEMEADGRCDFLGDYLHNLLQGY